MKRLGAADAGLLYFEVHEQLAGKPQRVLYERLGDHLRECSPPRIRWRLRAWQRDRLYAITKRRT